MQGTDQERLDTFDRLFKKLKANREKVPLEQLQTKYAEPYNALVAELTEAADWFADTYIDLLKFPTHPRDTAGNEWLQRKIEIIRQQEAGPGGLVEQYRAALIDRLDMREYRDKVWRIYDRLEREAFDPYWQRHNKWIGPPGRRWIYNDIFKKYWWEPKDGSPACWINRDYTGQDSRFPPHIKEDKEEAAKT